MEASVCRLRRQTAQIRHAIHGDMQGFQEAQAVQAHIGGFGVDHDIVKESIYGRTQGGQSLQAGGVLPCLKLRAAFGQDFLQGLKQVFFCIFSQQSGVDMGIDRAFDLGLFQDIADALVGCSQRRRFGQLRKSSHGF